MKSSIVSLFTFATSAFACASLGIDKRADGIEFSYQGDSSPKHWATLPGDNQACANDKTQTPIVIMSEDVPKQETSAVEINIASTESTTFANSGHDLRIEYQGGNLTRAGKTYNMLQAHFHSPSEHRINGEYYPVEMHMVFAAEDSSITVLGVPIEISAHGTSFGLLSSIFASAQDVPEKGDSTTTGPLDFEPLLTSVLGNDLYAYTGSLTTPPCTEKINWLVTSQPISISAANYLTIKKIMKFNSRTAQNLYDGSVNEPITVE